MEQTKVGLKEVGKRTRFFKRPSQFNQALKEIAKKQGLNINNFVHLSEQQKLYITETQKICKQV